MDEFEQAYRRTLAGDSGERETDTAASVLAARGDAWGSAADALAERVVRECGGRGWAPADLARVVARDLTPRHRRLAAALDDGSGAAAFAATERLDRFTAATLLVEVLRVYGRLPGIPAAPPAPAPVQGQGGKMLSRIRALLAKAESTAFPEEAEALSAKAQHLMARHRVDETLLHGENAIGGPGLRRIGVERPYEGAKALLLDAVASANRCEAVWSSDFGFSTVVGHEDALEAVELLYTSLLVQADRALAAGPSRSRDYRLSFLIAYASRIGERLTAATRDEVSARQDDPALLPALAAQDLAVRTATRRLFPNTTTSRLKGRDAEGWRSGRSAADDANL
ncbi:DUF2786 domain-containing protein [Streptomyces fuscigenes]|uniref:DUF2786 domain-containing protein n=1 Tax=Streptomyces fuscigenes TaxID=1528880 RepID=UPI001F255199|nr:DUF2786 domain-containing protein [Streptomyces fuscigenes]MCF3963969.1 DUF2786 domain-containing protein [Streptomyces fuscigenes]